MSANKWRVTEAADGSGEPVLIAGSTDNGMVSTWIPTHMAWVTPETAERMAAALVNAARTTRGRR